jgi:phenylalanyl-tRNA synthetase beta chain
MRFTLSWLRDHLETTAELSDITATLSAIGFEVEAVDDRAALAPFRIAHVIEAAPHPAADRLKVCRVDAGEGEVQVVCGAPNARSGMKAVFAPPGSFIPGLGVTLKVGRIRGVESAGMLLSAREIGIGEDHSGIVALPDEAPTGASYAAWAGLDDPVIEVNVTPNRGDALAVRGLARELAAAGRGTLRPFDPAPVPARFAAPFGWDIQWPEACPFVLGRSFRGLTNRESPDWLKRRLLAIGLRPINALVDITNYFTFDLGRPLHVFDQAKLAGDRLTLRRGRGETLRALNGRDYVLTEEDLVIADARGVVSLAGIMGGEASGCDETTTEVFLECAYFDPVRIGMTGRRLQIPSDARARFERGIDPALMPAALEAASRMILELCGGEAGEVVKAGAMPEVGRLARLRFRRLAAFGGHAVPAEEAIARLEALGFAVTARDAEAVVVQVPSWRHDVAPLSAACDFAPSIDAEKQAELAARAAEAEAEADLVEEVLRIGGLDAVPPVSLRAPVPVPEPAATPLARASALTRRVLASRGLAETVGFSFISRDLARRLGGAPEELRLLNPIAADLDQLRPTPLGSLLLALARNRARGWGMPALFEIGPAFDDAGEHHVAAGIRGGTTPRHWAEPSRPLDAFDAKADLYAVFAALGVAPDTLAVQEAAALPFHPGRSAVIGRGAERFGRFGELHPELLAALDLEGPVVGFEVFLDRLPSLTRRRPPPLTLSPFQPIRRDFAFLVDRDVPAEAIVRAARGAERSLIRGVQVFDVYEGETVPAGRKSVAIEVLIAPTDHVLSDAEIQAVAERVVKAVEKATGAVLRR